MAGPVLSVRAGVSGWVLIWGFVFVWAWFFSGGVSFLVGEIGPGFSCIMAVAAPGDNASGSG